MCRTLIYFSSAILLLCLVGQELCGQNVNVIPNPLPEAWVVDQTETLSDLQRKLINELCKDIQEQYRRQMVVVVVTSTNGDNPRRVAVELFNRWRVGDGYKNQGVLVFAAMNDRAAEIVLGYGIDNRNTGATAQSIMDTVMKPKFKTRDAGGAIYEGVHACAKRIIGVGELTVPDKLPEITAEQPVVTAEQPLEDSQTNAVGANEGKVNAATVDLDLAPSTIPQEASGNREPNGMSSAAVSTVGSKVTDTGSADVFQPVTLPPFPGANPPLRGKGVQHPAVARRNPSYLPWLLGLGGVGALAMIFGTRRYLRYRRRTCDSCRLDRVLLTEIQDDDFLEPPQRIEEKIGSVDYDVWACLECEDVIKLRYGQWFTRYSKCPECRYVTRFKISETVIPATTMNGGVIRVKEFCKHCDYQHVYTYATPRIPRQRSGSSSGSIFAGGGSRGSRGGFSSGGGASGRW